MELSRLIVPRTTRDVFCYHLFLRNAMLIALPVKLETLHSTDEPGERCWLNIARESCRKWKSIADEVIELFRTFFFLHFCWQISRLSFQHMSLSSEVFHFMSRWTCSLVHIFIIVLCRFKKKKKIFSEKVGTSKKATFANTENLILRFVTFFAVIVGRWWILQFNKFPSARD